MGFNLKRLTQMIIKSYNTKIQKNYNHFFQVQAVNLIDEKAFIDLKKSKSPTQTA